MAARWNSSLAPFGARRRRRSGSRIAFEVCEQYLDLLARIAGGDIGVGPGDVARHLARALMPGSRDLPRRLVGRAPGLQRAGGAVLFPSEVLLEPVLAELGPLLRNVAPVWLQRLSTRAGVLIGLMIVGEVGGRECARPCARTCRRPGCAARCLRPRRASPACRRRHRPCPPPEAQDRGRSGP